MHSVGVVRRDHETVRQVDEIILPGKPQAFVRPCQSVIQEGRRGALFRAASDLLVVQDTVDCHVLFLFPFQKTFQGREGALKVVQTAGGEELSRCAPDARVLAVVEEEVVAEDVFRSCPGSIRDHLHEGVFGSDISVEREHIFLCVVFISVVDLAVHVDGKIGDHQKVPVHIDKDGAQRAGRAVSGTVPDDHPSCHGERAVEPGSADHSAVTLHIQFDVVPVSLHLRILLDLERGRITVACHDTHPFHILLRDGECDQGRAVPGHKISAAFFNMPFLIFPQFCKAFFSEHI